MSNEGGETNPNAKWGKENVTACLNLELCFSESSYHLGIVLSLGIDQQCNRLYQAPSEDFTEVPKLRKGFN